MFPFFPFITMANTWIDFPSWREIGTNSNPKRYEKKTSGRTRKHADKHRKMPPSKQKRRRNVGLKERLLSENRSELLWGLLACLFRRPRLLGESSGIGLFCVCILLGLKSVSQVSDLWEERLIIGQEFKGEDGVIEVDEHSVEIHALM